MGLIQNFLDRMKEKKYQKENYERGRHIEERFEEKKLSANERELMRFHEEERQKQIKVELERFRKIKSEEAWSGKKNNPIHAPNVIANQPNLFKGQDNLFLKKSDLFTKKDNMFTNG